MLPVDPPRPAARNAVLQRLRLTSPAKGGRRTVLDQLETLARLAAILLDPQSRQVFPVPRFKLQARPSSSSIVANAFRSSGARPSPPTVAWRSPAGASAGSGLFERLKSSFASSTTSPPPGARSPAAGAVADPIAGSLRLLRSLRCRSIDPTCLDLSRTIILSSRHSGQSATARALRQESVAPMGSVSFEAGVGIGPISPLIVRGCGATSIVAAVRPPAACYNRVGVDTDGDLPAAAISVLSPCGAARCRGGIAPEGRSSSIDPRPSC